MLPCDEMVAYCMLGLVCVSVGPLKGCFILFYYIVPVGYSSVSGLLLFHCLLQYILYLYYWDMMIYIIGTLFPVRLNKMIKPLIYLFKCHFKSKKKLNL